MTKRARLDTELVRRGLARSRAEARLAIDKGVVTVSGMPATRAATLVSSEDPITVAKPARRFVSRGGEKLDSALEHFDVVVEGRRWLDAGASTGGFTHRLLVGGASAVAAVDVGYGQLDWSLRNDPRVVVVERKNVRELSPEDLPWVPEGIVADLSFISLALVLPRLRSVAEPEADYLLLVKPQFELSADEVGRGGVVRSPESWKKAVSKVVEEAKELGLAPVDVALAQPPGPAGNREFFIHLRAGEPHPDRFGEALDEAIVEAQRP